MRTACKGILKSGEFNRELTAREAVVGITGGKKIVLRIVQIHIKINPSCSGLNHSPPVTYSAFAKGIRQTDYNSNKKL